MNDPVITTHRLTRYFGKNCAVEELSIVVPRGAVTALLGRNGSGKTTTLRMLLGLLEPTRGRSTVLGHDSRKLPPEVRARVGYLSENHPLIGWMTVAQMARFQAAFYPRWNQRIFDATVDHFGLSGRTKTAALSRGQRAGVALAITLAPEPELLVLDDPALGLDPVARRALLESILFIIRSPERTVLLSSHLLDDVERVADYLVILDKAVVRAACPVEVFRERIAQYELAFAGAPPALPELPGMLDSLRMENGLRVMVANPGGDLEAKLRGLGAVSCRRVETNLVEAVTAYMSDHRSRGFFLEQLGGAA